MWRAAVVGGAAVVFTGVAVPAGASSYTTVKKATSSGTGALRTTVKATGTGTWRWSCSGDSASGAKSSTGDHVAVR